MKQELYRRYAPLRYGALCVCAALALWGLSLLSDGSLLLLLPLPALAAAGIPYYFSSYTYRYDGGALAIWSGGLRRPRLLVRVGVEDIISYGLYLPGQLSARTARCITRAVLPLDPRPKRYLLYRLEGGGTGLVLFSPDQSLQGVFTRDVWLFQPS